MQRNRAARRRRFEPEQHRVMIRHVSRRDRNPDQRHRAAVHAAVGPHDFGGALHTAMTAHPKTCPTTGELLFFGYSLRPPHLTYYRADAEGRITLPGLIPGSLYRITDFSTVNDPARGAKVRKEFTVQSGETLDLGDLLIEKPQG